MLVFPQGALTSLLSGTETDFHGLTHISDGLLHVGENIPSQMNPIFTSKMQMVGIVFGTVLESTLLSYGLGWRMS